VKSISRKYKRAISSREESHNILKDLSACVEEEKRKIWEGDERKAMSSRGDHLKIYDVVLDTGGQIPVVTRQLLDYPHTSSFNGSNLASTSRD
jgi:hypothetical protein